MKANKPDSIDNYISGFPAEIQQRLVEIRNLIRQAAPEATEKISYQMPTFFLHKNLVHFAAYKNHIGFYPTPSAINKFKSKLKPYHFSKGAVQFPADQPLPAELITEMVLFRVRENRQMAGS